MAECTTIDDLISYLSPKTLADAWCDMDESTSHRTRTQGESETMDKLRLALTTIVGESECRKRTIDRM